jgi:hypothetical protein
MVSRRIADQQTPRTRLRRLVSILATAIVVTLVIALVATIVFMRTPGTVDTGASETVPTAEDGASSFSLPSSDTWTG